jgi:hypothetical protein
MVVLRAGAASDLLTAGCVGSGDPREDCDRRRNARVFEREVVDVGSQLGDLRKLRA